MATGEIISIIAVVLSFLGVLSSFIFSYKKADREREQERANNIENITVIKKDIISISTDISDIKKKFDKIDEKMNSDHDKITEHETRIKNLEKEVFNKKKGA